MGGGKEREGERWWGSWKHKSWQKRSVSGILSRALRQFLQSKLFHYPHPPTHTHHPPTHTGAVGYFETSALTGTGMTDAMHAAMRAGLNPGTNGRTGRRRFVWPWKRWGTSNNTHLHDLLALLILCDCVLSTSA